MRWALFSDFHQLLLSGLEYIVVRDVFSWLSKGNWVLFCTYNIQNICWNELKSLYSACIESLAPVTILKFLTVNVIVCSESISQLWQGKKCLEIHAWNIAKNLLFMHFLRRCSVVTNGVMESNSSLFVTPDGLIAFMLGTESGKIYLSFLIVASWTNVRYSWQVMHQQAWISCSKYVLMYSDMVYPPSSCCFGGRKPWE